MLIEYPSGKTRKASRAQAKLLEKLGKARIVMLIAEPAEPIDLPPDLPPAEPIDLPPDLPPAEPIDLPPDLPPGQPEAPETIESLRDVAKSMGLKVPPRIGAEKLQAMIEGAK